MQNLHNSPNDLAIRDCEENIRNWEYLLSESETINLTFDSRMEEIQKEINALVERRKAICAIKRDAEKNKKDLPNKIAGAKQKLGNLLLKRAGLAPEATTIRAAAYKTNSGTRKPGRVKETLLEKAIRLTAEIANLQDQINKATKLK